MLGGGGPPRLSAGPAGAEEGLGRPEARWTLMTSPTTWERAVHSGVTHPKDTPKPAALARRDSRAVAATAEAKGQHVWATSAAAVERTVSESS